MDAVDRFIRTIKELESSVFPTLKNTIDRNKGVLLDKQEDQLDDGKDSLGISFIPSYAESTIKTKKRKGQPTDRVTLKDTGDLYRSLNIETNSNQMIITANVEYFKYLVRHYDSNIILGLEKEFLRDFIIKYFKPELLRTWRQIIRR